MTWPWALDASEDAVSHALRRLRTVSFVSSRNEGRVVYYCLVEGFPEPLRQHCLRQLMVPLHDRTMAAVKLRRVVPWLLVRGDGMTGRRLGILVLLVAFLSMHGVQYMSAAAHGPAAMTADHTLDAAAVAALGLAPIALAAEVGMTMAPEQTAAASTVAKVTMPGHGMPDHLMALCLAVLLAGLALLGAALARCTNAARVRKPASLCRATLHRSPPPRPPDLSALCLLRI